MAEPEFTTEELINEAWRAIPSYEGFYSVSNLGRIKSDRNITNSKINRLLSLTLNTSGYYTFMASVNNKKRRLYVHRCVASAFHGPCPSGYVANHLDGCKTNNRDSNLEWETLSGNAQHAIRHGLVLTGDRHPARTHGEYLARGERHGNAVFSEAQVRELKSLLKAGWSVKQLRVRYGVSRGAIERIKNGRGWLHIKETQEAVCSELRCAVQRSLHRT